MKPTPNQLEASTVVQASPRHATCQLDGEAVILSMDTGAYYGLGGVGLVVWNLLQEPRSIRAVCEQVMQEYQVGVGRCSNDVTRLVAHLVHTGLLRVHEGS